MGDSKDNVGKRNEKVPDSSIQGEKAGQRNRTDTEAGKVPPPAGETAQGADDPRKLSRS